MNHHIYRSQVIKKANSLRQKIFILINTKFCKHSVTHGSLCLLVDEVVSIYIYTFKLLEFAHTLSSQSDVKF